MKLFLIGLLALGSLSSFASAESNCPAEKEEISSYQKEIISMFLEGRIERSDVRTLGLATAGLLNSGLDCELLRLDLDNIKATASKL